MLQYNLMFNTQTVTGYSNELWHFLITDARIWFFRCIKTYAHSINNQYLCVTCCICIDGDFFGVFTSKMYTVSPLRTFVHMTAHMKNMKISVQVMYA